MRLRMPKTRAEVMMAASMIQNPTVHPRKLTPQDVRPARMDLLVRGDTPDVGPGTSKESGPPRSGGSTDA